MAASDRSTGRCKPASQPMGHSLSVLMAAASLVGAVQRLAVMSGIMVLWERLARWLQCEDLDLPKSLSSAICS